MKRKSPETSSLRQNPPKKKARVEKVHNRPPVPVKTIASQESENNSLKLNFVANDDDHCETDPQAYEDVEPVLAALSASLGKSKSSVRIYDPYYCEGGVKRHLGSLGFDSVINENADFYAQISQNNIPEFDILVTNPPYSGDHLKKCAEFAKNCGKPFLLLIPSFVREKKYAFWSPLKGESKTAPPPGSPFSTFWYLYPGKFKASIIKNWNSKANEGGLRASLVLSAADIPKGVQEKKHRKPITKNAYEKEKPENPNWLSPEEYKKKKNLLKKRKLEQKRKEKRLLAAHSKGQDSGSSQ